MDDLAITDSIAMFIFMGVIITLIFFMVWFGMQPPPIGYGHEHLVLTGVWANITPSP